MSEQFMKDLAASVFQRLREKDREIARLRQENEDLKAELAKDHNFFKAEFNDLDAKNGD